MGDVPLTLAVAMQGGIANIQQGLAELDKKIAETYVEINNLLGTSKVCNIRVQIGSGAAGTIPILDFGGGEWVNTSAQITSVQLVVAGANSLLANTGFVVFGRNF